MHACWGIHIVYHINHIRCIQMCDIYLQETAYPYPSLGKPWRKWIRRATWGGLSLNLGVFELGVSPQFTHTVKGMNELGQLGCGPENIYFTPYSAILSPSHPSFASSTSAVFPTPGGPRRHTSVPLRVGWRVPHQSSVHWSAWFTT